MSIPDLSQPVVRENLKLSDGTTLTLEKTQGISDNEWEETRRWLEENPEEARRMEMYTKDAGAVRSHLHQQALVEYYQSKLNFGDEQVSAKIAALERNPEFVHIFEDIKRSGPQAAMQHYHNEPLMMKLSRAMGGVPEEARGALEKVQQSPITFQEACKWGKLSAVQDYLKANGQNATEARDNKGITGLGHAVGANRTAIVKALLDVGASLRDVDTSGGTALHYAAAYGRQELVEFFLKSGCNVNDKNTQGQTALALATKNKQAAVAAFLKTKGGQM